MFNMQLISTCAAGCNPLGRTTYIAERNMSGPVNVTRRRMLTFSGLAVAGALSARL